MTPRQTVALASLAALALAMLGAVAVPHVIPRATLRNKLFLPLRARYLGATLVTASDILLQPRASDCGATCLKAVLRTHGIERDLWSLETQLLTTRRGTSLRNLRVVSEREGLPARSWKLATADLMRAPLPAIAFVNGDHFVVVRRAIDSETLEVDDPALGRLHWPLRAFRSRWSGETLLFDSAWRP